MKARADSKVTWRTVAFSPTYLAYLCRKSQYQPMVLGLLPSVLFVAANRSISVVRVVSIFALL